MSEPRMYTPASLAKQWKCSEGRVRGLIASGALEAWRYGGKLLRISPHAAQSFVNRTTPKKPAPGFVYFIRSGSFVKIGYTTNLETRVRNISTAAATAPVILHTEPGTRKDEQAYHRRFAALRANGEWFRLEGSLASHLESIGAAVA